MTVRLGINGFGRIGRLVFRHAFHTRGVDVVAVNDVGNVETLAHLLKYDSNYGEFEPDVSVKDGQLEVANRLVPLSVEDEPSQLNWGQYDVDIVVESTGQFRKREQAAQHLRGGAKKVLISAPGKNVDYTVVMGVNENGYDPDKHDVVSNASCTTNCLAPVAKVLDDAFGIKRGEMTTVHAYTTSQNLLDAPHSDIRRARGAAQSIIPTTTGAARAVGEVLPHLAGKLSGMALRVPTPTVSIVDLAVELQDDVTIEQVNDAFVAAEEGPMNGILGTSSVPLVSVDYVGESRSAVVDLLVTDVIDKRLVKVLAWYDNEWGYACRIVDLVRFMSEKGLRSEARAGGPPKQSKPGQIEP